MDSLCPLTSPFLFIFASSKRERDVERWFTFPFLSVLMVLPLFQRCFKCKIVSVCTSPSFWDSLLSSDQSTVDPLLVTLENKMVHPPILSSFLEQVREREVKLWLTENCQLFFTLSFSFLGQRFQFKDTRNVQKVQIWVSHDFSLSNIWFKQDVLFSSFLHSLILPSIQICLFPSVSFYLPSSLLFSMNAKIFTKENKRRGNGENNRPATRRISLLRRSSLSYPWIDIHLF